MRVAKRVSLPGRDHHWLSWDIGTGQEKERSFWIPARPLTDSCRVWADSHTPCLSLNWSRKTSNSADRSIVQLVEGIASRRPPTPSLIFSLFRRGGTVEEGSGHAPGTPNTHSIICFEALSVTRLFLIKRASTLHAARLLAEATLFSFLFFLPSPLFPLLVSPAPRTVCRLQVYFILDIDRWLAR